jgi:hypothetical protein
VRALVSSTNPGKLFDLRCDVREGLIEFLRRTIRKVPRVRNVTVPLDEEIQRGKSKDGAAASGTEHERGSKLPDYTPTTKATALMLRKNTNGATGGNRWLLTSHICPPPSN